MKTFLVLLLSALGLQASTVQFYMTNSAGVADTNYFRLIPIENPVLANGGVITRGPALRCYPAATGFFQTNLTVGWWQMTNSFLGQGILLEVPNDSFTYNATNLMVSGFNTYVMSGLVGVTSSNGSVTIYPPAGRGTVDLAASGSIPIMAGSNIVIYQAGGSNVINSTASGTGSGVTNNQVLPGASSATNFSANLINSTNAAALDTNILYVAMNGNDSTAIRGQPNHPWASFSVAVAAAASNDTVQVGPGRFYFNKIDPLPYVKINGSGWSTVLLGTNTTGLDYYISMTNGTTLSNFRLSPGGPTVGQTATAYTYPIVCGKRAVYTSTAFITNVVMDNIWVDGHTDTLSVNSDVFLIAKNCYFSSFWDLYTCKYGTFVAVQQFLNCVAFARIETNVMPADIFSANVGGDLSCYIPAQSVDLRVIGGSAICTNAIGQSSPFANFGSVTSNFRVDGVDVRNTPAPGNPQNVPGQPAYYLFQGLGTIVGHGYPESRCSNMRFEGDATNSFAAGAFMGVNTDGERFWNFNASTLTNISVLQTPGHSFYATNNVLYNLGLYGWVTPDNLAAENILAGSIVLANGTGGILDSLGGNRLLFNTAHTDLYGPSSGGSFQMFPDGNAALLSQTLTAGVFRATSGTFSAANTVTNGQTNLFLTANQLIASGPQKQMSDVFIGSGLTLGGSPLTLSGTGGAGGWGNLEDKGTNETALGYFVFVNPTNSNNGTNWTYFTGTNWAWSNVGTNGGGGYKTNTFYFGNGSTSNVLQILNPSGQAIITGGTNGPWIFGTNRQMVLDTSGNLTISGQFNGSGSGLTAGSVPFAALPQVAGYSTLANPNAGAAVLQPVNTALLLDPIGNLVGGVAIRHNNSWTNSGASAVTALLSSANVTNVLSANSANVTNQLVLWGLAPASYITVGTANGLSNTISTANGSNDLNFFVGNTLTLSLTNNGFTIPSGINTTNKGFSTGIVHADANGKLTSSALVAGDMPLLSSAYPQALTNSDNRGGIYFTNPTVGAVLRLDPTNFVQSNSVALLQITNGHIYITNYGAAGRGIDIDPANSGSVFYGDNNATNYLSITTTSVIESNAYGIVELRGDSIISSNRNTGSYSSLTNGIGTNTGKFQTGGFLTAGALAFGAGTTGTTNTFAAQFSYNNLQYSTNCGWGGVQSNGTANTTLTLKGFEEFVASMGNTIVQLGDATTNLGHHIAITCGSSGTNAITTVSSQKIAGQTKWTNTAIFTCTQLISDGSNWQICGTRGN